MSKQLTATLGADDTQAEILATLASFGLLASDDTSLAGETGDEEVVASLLKLGAITEA